MNGYLQRLVERHARARPGMRLRVPSRFEGDLVGDTVEAEAPPLTAVAAGRGPESSEAPHRSAHPRARPRSADGAGVPVTRRPGTIEAQPMPRPAGPAADVIPRVAPSAHGSIHPPGTTSTVVARRATPRPAVPLRTQGIDRLTTPRREADPHRARMSAGPMLPAEPDVVHVHIGRVEVRAVVAPPETRRPVDRPSRPAPLSLDRYLSRERQR